GEEVMCVVWGGKREGRLPVYATTPRADLAKEWGFHGAKLPCRYGPADGIEGLKKNVAVVAEAREQVGPDFPLRLDCYMALTVPYSIELSRALHPSNLPSIHDCFPPYYYPA